MKAAPAPLIALLNSGADFQMADLWTFTLVGGSVVRWSSADVAITANGNTYALGPIIERGSISEKRGLQVATLSVTITANAADLINGVPLIPFIAKRGLDGANVRLDRAFMPDWGAAIAGTVLRFAGRVTAVDSVSGSTATITVSAWTVLLDLNMPAHLYQTACIHTVYDAGCGLLASAFSFAGSVASTPAPTATTFASTITGRPNAFAQGRIKWLTGRNAGVARAVRTNDTAGNFELINPMAYPPLAGETFTAVYGCDRTSPTCSGVFNNIIHFKGTEFVPTPETAL